MLIASEDGSVVQMAKVIKDGLEVGTPGLEDQGHEGRLVKEMETQEAREVGQRPRKCGNLVAKRR